MDSYKDQDSALKLSKTIAKLYIGQSIKALDLGKISIVFFINIPKLKSDQN